MAPLTKNERLDMLAKEADSYMESGNYRKAAETLERILEIEPDDERTLIVKVQLLLFFRKLRDADRTISKVVLLYPKNYYAYLTKAIVTVLYKADVREAIAHIGKGLEIKPDCFELVIAKAQMLYWIRDPSYNIWIEAASRIDPLQTQKFLEKYWMEKLPVPVSHITAQIAGLLQNLMFIVSQQKYGAWK